MQKNERHIQPQIRNTLFQKAIKQRIPISGTFELTPRCNMDCRMCYIRMSKEEMSSVGRERTAQEWIRMAEECRDAGLLFLLITGGEPFLREDFKEIYTALNRMGFIMSINSNGTMITEETVEWLKKCPPSRLNITLYGSGNDTYQKLCGNPRGYDQVKRAITLLMEAGIYVRLNASFTPYNVADMEEIYAFAKERKIPIRTNLYMFPAGKEKSRKRPQARLTPCEAGEAMFYSKKYQMSEAQFDIFLKAMEYQVRLPHGSENCAGMEDEGREKMGCMAGRSSFWITWDGKMLPCGMMSRPVTHPFEDGFEKSWKVICDETDKILLPDACAQCKKRFACNICGALTIAESGGDSTKKPEYMCGMTDRYLALCREYREKSGERKKSINPEWRLI